MIFNFLNHNQICFCDHVEGIYNIFLTIEEYLISFKEINYGNISKYYSEKTRVVDISRLDPRTYNENSIGSRNFCGTPRYEFMAFVYFSHGKPIPT